jgi:hypothetical protein
MMVIRYTLECGAELELLVPSDQVRENQVTGHINAWCPTCHVEHPVSRVYLGAR